MISQEHGEYLLNIAKKAVKTYLETGEQILVPEDCPEELKEKLGVFVTLNKNNQLRGCIGYPEPIESAIQARDEKESIYQSVTKAVDKFSTEELVAYQFRSAEKSVKDTLRYFAIEHIVQEIILEKALKRG